MDKGRQIDKTQNLNALHLDKFRINGKTSTKITHPPGGETHINLSWEINQSEPNYKYGRKRFEQNNNNYSNYSNFNK